MGVVLSSNDLEVSTRVRAMRKLLILPFVLVAVIYAAWPGVVGMAAARGSQGT